MAVNYVDLERTNTVTGMGTHAYKITLAIKRDCDKTCNYLLKDCGSLNNCTLCKADIPFCLPFSDGHTIDFHSRVIDEYNPDETQPANGWGTFMIIELCDKDNNVISSDHTQFSNEYVVGWDGDMNSYQTIQVDLNAAYALAGDCFSFKITAYDSNNIAKNTYCSEPFIKVHNCESLITLEGVYPDTDCCESYYGEAPLASNWVGTSNYKYSNKIYVKGSIEKDSPTVEVESFGSKRSSVTRNSIFNVNLHQKIPCYLNDYIANIFDAPISYVNDVEYDNDGFQPDNVAGLGSYYLWSFQVFQSCEKNFLCG